MYLLVNQFNKINKFNKFNKFNSISKKKIETFAYYFTHIRNIMTSQTITTNIKICFTDKNFWDLFISQNPHKMKNLIEYILEEFGTFKQCNRFDIGNSIEFIINDYMQNMGLEITELPNASRIDVDICNYKKLSIKYSSSGDIKLHNSNSCENKDINMKDTILLTPENLYLITNEELMKNNIDIKSFIKNTKDGLALKRAVLTQLKKIEYPFIYNINIKHDKKNCKNRLTSKIFYEYVKKEFNSRQIK